MFRERGASGSGIDAVAAAAQVTSGAIYRHFGSKEALFDEVIAEGLERLADTITRMRRQDQENWVERMIEFYVGSRHVGDPGGGCLLPNLSVDVDRASPAVRETFASGFDRAIAALTSDDSGAGLDREHATLLLASLLGAVVLSRATGNDDIRRILKTALLKQTSTPASSGPETT